MNSPICRPSGADLNLSQDAVAAFRPDEQGLLTIREAAGLLRLSESTIRNAIRLGQLRAFRFGVRGGSIRIDRVDLDDYISSCAAPAARVPSPAASTGGTFKNLDAGRLLAAWRRQGVRGGPKGDKP